MMSKNTMQNTEVKSNIITVTFYQLPLSHLLSILNIHFYWLNHCTCSITLATLFECE